MTSMIDAYVSCTESVTYYRTDGTAPRRTRCAHIRFQRDGRDITPPALSDDGDVFSCSVITVTFDDDPYSNPLSIGVHDSHGTVRRTSMSDDARAEYTAMAEQALVAEYGKAVSA